ncbi:Crp/Fnr family transcriptional regulator [Candidatus Bipolaricaulota bacterium]|nr:Crp/Fnr family transcriptional regulator [Candidatus Bipolaricaulota bacterium]
MTASSPIGVGNKSDPESKINFLARTFSSLDKDRVVELAEFSLPVRFEEGELIAQEGSYASGVYIVDSGLVSIGKYSSRGWEKRCLRFLAPGEIFGLEAVLLEREPVNVQFCKAIVASTLLFFEHSNFLAFVKRHPQILMDLSRWLAREVIMLEFKLTREAIEATDRNLALFLIALAHKYGSAIPEKEGVEVNLPLSRQTMAELLGLSVETLMRTLKRFRELGLISTSKNSFRVLNLEGLEERARVTSFYLSIVEETL